MIARAGIQPPTEAWPVHLADNDRADPFAAVMRRWSDVVSTIERADTVPIDASALGPPAPRPGKIVWACRSTTPIISGR